MKSISSITSSLLLLVLLFVGDAAAQWPTKATDNAVAIRCVNTAGTAFEACGGSGGGGGGTSSVDKSLFTASTTPGTPTMGVMDDVSPSTCLEGQQCVSRSTANRALHVNLRDASGNELSVGGGTQYAQGTASTDTDTMNMLGCRRADTAAAATGIAALDRAGCIVDSTQRLWTHVGTIDGGTITNITNPVAVTGTFYPATQPVSNAGTFAVQAAQSGTWTVQPGNTANTTPWLTTIMQGGNAAAVNASGQLSITCANCSGSGASAVDNSAFTVGSTSGAPIMGLFDNTTPSSATEDRAAALRMSANRSLYVNIRDAAGNERGLNIDASGNLTANIAGTVTVGSHAVTNAGTFAVQADTELPAAVALADATSNPTVPGVAAFNLCFNGTNWDRCQKTTDPCQANTKSYANINGTAGATIITGTASKKIYPCSLVLVTATTQNVNLVSGTGTTCGTGTTAILGLSGGTTAATGWSFAANGGLTLGTGGFSLGQTQNNADNVCLLMSGSGQVTGGMSYVVQ